MPRKLLVLASLSLAALLIAPLAAEEARAPQTVHVHGEARLELVQEGADLSAALFVPAMDVVGFERAPSGPVEQAAIASAEASLGRVDGVLQLIGAAACTVASAEARFEGGESEEHEEGSEHHEEDAEDQEDGDEQHAELEAAYAWTCASPAKLEGVEVRIFDILPALEEVHVEFATPRGQGSMEATPAKRTVRF